MINDKLQKIIEDLVHQKSMDLSTWKKVQWQGGRVYVEIGNIQYEIRDFNIETKIFYIEKLLEESFIVQDNLPLTAPIVTQEFRGELQKLLYNLQINHLQADKLTKSKTKKKRIAIPSMSKALLQKEIGSKCPFCKNDDVHHFQIHHIDENPENNGLQNLLMLCPNCHSKITKKDILRNKVLEVKKKLSNS